MYDAPSRLAVLTRRRARIEIIPLIDVIFFLLATFVIFALAMSATRSFAVTLPFPGKAEGESDTVTIQVSGGGAVYWNRELMAATEVPARLALYKTQTDRPRVVIAGDERADFGAAVAVIDELHAAGITQFTVETRTRRTGQ